MYQTFHALVKGCATKRLLGPEQSPRCVMIRQRFEFTVFFLHWDHPFVRNAPPRSRSRHELQQSPVVDAPKEVLDVGIQDVVAARGGLRPQRINRTPSRSESYEHGSPLEEGFHHPLRRHLPPGTGYLAFRAYQEELTPPESSSMNADWARDSLANCRSSGRTVKYSLSRWDCDRTEKC